MGTVTPALAADTTKPLWPEHESIPFAVEEVDGGTVTWESGGANGVATLATGPLATSRAAVHLELLPSNPLVKFGELNQVDYVLAGGTKGSATLSFELIVSTGVPGNPFDYPAAQFIPPNGATGLVDADGEDPTTTADGYWRFDGGAATSFEDLQANADYTINKIYLSLGSQVANSSSSVDSVTVGTAAGATIYDFQVPPPAAATPTEVYPGALGEGQVDGWDLVASVGGGETRVENDSGWSMDPDGTGYAVLDPTAFLDDLGTVSLDTGNYNAGVELGEIEALAVSARTDGEGAGPRITLRLTGGNITGTCRIIAQVPPTSVMTEFNALAAIWAESQAGTCPALGAPTGWGGVKAALGSTATISGGAGVPGVSISTGSTRGTGWAPAHIESFTLVASGRPGLNDTYAFGPPKLTLSGDPVEVQAGESVDVLVSGTLSGPNQPTIENVANFLTGPGGLNSGGTFGQTGGTEGLCSVELAEPVTMFAPDRVLPTRPLEAVGAWSEVALATEAPVTVRVSASINAGGVGVGGTCVIGIVNPLNAEPIGGVTVTVTPVDTRPALPLPDDVPAGTGALTVDPECLVGGDTMTVTAPAGSFAPNSAVSVGLYDSGIDVGEFEAEADGSLSIEAALPTGVPDGPQTVLVVGYASTDNNDPANLSAEFEVGCDGSGGSGQVPSGIPAGNGGADDGNGLLGAGVVLLVALGGFLARRRWMHG